MSFTRHWKLERIVSAALVPVIGSYFVMEHTAIPNALLTVLLPFHCFQGLEACVIDYVPKRKFPMLNPVATGALYATTGIAFLGLAKMNYDVGLKQYFVKAWNAKKILAYTLEALISSDIQLIYIFSAFHAEQVKEFVDSLCSKAEIRLVATNAMSQGDVLRELDGMGIIQDDFVLVNGDLVTNVRINEALEAHRSRKDKECMCTLVVKEASPGHKTRNDEAVWVVDTKTKGVLHYESVVPKKKRIDVEHSVIFKSNDVEFHYDWMDPQIDICSADIPALFTENFDYQELRSDFLYGVLTSDLLTKTVYYYLVEDEYAARVTSPSLLDAISKDIMSRWSFPLVPDSDWFHHGLARYLFQSAHSVYRGMNVKLARSVSLWKVVIGNDSAVGQHSSVTSSTIGNHCQIESNVSIADSYVHDNALIHSHTQLNNCIIEKGALIGEGVRLDHCIVGQDAIIEPNTHLSDKRLMRQSPTTPQPIKFGSVWEYVDSIDEEQDSDIQDTVSTCSEESEQNDFFKEAALTLERSIREKHSMDIAMLELNTLKLAFDASFSDIRDIVIPGILNVLDFKDQNVGVIVKKLLAYWAPLWKKFTSEESEQVHAMHLIHDYFREKDPVTTSAHFVYTIRYAYELDVLEGEAIEIWWEQVEKTELTDRLKPFIDWLQEDDESE